MQTRLYSLKNKDEFVKRLDLEPVLIRKPSYLSLFPAQTKTICATLNKGDPKDQIRKENGMLVGPPIRKMNNCEVNKVNDFRSVTKNICDNDLLITFGKKQENNKKINFKY